MQEQKEIENPDEDLLYWRFDLSTFRLLGRELITDRITALFELVKNCYDANAQEVTVEFLNVNSPDPLKSKIVITDDGDGMTMSDIKTKWMVIGTNSKRVSRISKEPYKRKFVGKKGVGRFAVDKLGSKVVIKSKTDQSTFVNCVEVDWSIYDTLSAKNDKNIAEQNSNDTIEIIPQYFTEVPNKSWTEQSTRGKGTTLEITIVRDPWIESDIARSYQELAKLISPLHKSKYPFNITIKSNDYSNYKEVDVKNKAVKHSTLDFDLEFKNGLQEVLQFENGELKKIKEPQKLFGPVRFRLYYFDQKAKETFKKNYLGGSIDGIKIYRDGLIATPFAEYENNDQKKRDILGIDKRRYSGFLEKVSSQDLLGIVEITDADNPQIIDSTNRQDFVDNLHYRELKQFIVSQLVELEDYLKHQKKSERQNTKSTLRSAHDNLKSFTSFLREVKKDAPKKMQKQLLELQRQARKVEIEVKQGIKDYNALEQHLIRQEDTFMSLMSLQEYAYEIAHVVRTSVAKIIRLGEFFSDEFPNPEYENLFLTYARDIYSEMSRLERAVDFMLSYSKASSNFSEINVKELLENLFTTYEPIFKRENIKAKFEMDSPLIIVHNYKFVEDIFENLISNSVKALRKVNHKVIRCTAIVGEDGLEVTFSDTGVGIPDIDKERIFKIFYTTTPEEGGAGIGLYIVRTRLEAMKGSIKVIENELKPQGASFHIQIPFLKKDNKQ